MSVIKLPFDSNPPLKASHIIAHPLGIILGNNPNNEYVWSLLINKYVNCNYLLNEGGKNGVFNIDEWDLLFTNDKILYELYFEIHKLNWQKMLDITREKFLKFIKDNLLKGYYIWGTYNDKYIRNKNSYAIADKLDDYLIFGYDDNTQSFMSAGYTKSGLYEDFLIKYSEYYDSIFNVDSFESQLLRLLKYNNECNYNMDLCRLKELLLHYINSVTYEDKYDINKKYGISACEKLIDDLNNNLSIDDMQLQIFAEHKMFMFQRLLVLSEYNVINSSIIDEYSIVNSHSNNLKQLIQKHKSENYYDLRLKYIEIIKKILDIERQLIPQAVENLSTYIGKSENLCVLEKTE